MSCRSCSAATGSATPCCALPASSWPRSGARSSRVAAANPYDVLGVSKTRPGRRDQEGVPQARSGAPPRQESRRPDRRGAVQGRPGRLRHPLGRREAPGVRPVRRGGPAGLRPGRRPLRERRPRRSLRPARQLRLVLRTRPARGPAPPRAWRRSRVARADLVRGRPRRRPGTRPRRGRDGLPRLWRDGRRAGHRAADVPRLPRERRHRRQPGPLRALPPVPALPRATASSSTRRARTAAAPGASG